MKVQGELAVTLDVIYLRGVDALGNAFDVALDHETARRLVFKLHAMVMEQARMRLRADAERGGKAG